MGLANRLAMSRPPAGCPSLTNLFRSLKDTLENACQHDTSQHEALNKDLNDLFGTLLKLDKLKGASRKVAVKIENKSKEGAVNLGDIISAVRTVDTRGSPALPVVRHLVKLLKSVQIKLKECGPKKFDRVVAMITGAALAVLCVGIGSAILYGDILMSVAPELASKLLKESETYVRTAGDYLARPTTRAIRFTGLSKKAATRLAVEHPDVFNRAAALGTGTLAGLAGGTAAGAATLAPVAMARMVSGSLKRQIWGAPNMENKRFRMEPIHHVANSVGVFNG